jgi:signal transduction histidine kinase/ActR/RegA family two-component response regulator
MGTAPEELTETRLRLLRSLLTGLAVVGLPAWVLHTLSMVELGLWVHLIFGSVGYGLVVLCALLPKRVPFGLRAAALEIALFGLAIDTLVRFGLSGGGPALLLMVAVLATVLFGLRSGLIFGAICMASMALVGVGFVTGVLVLSPSLHQTGSSIEAWGPVTAVVTVACLVLVMAPGLLQRDLLRSLRQREQAAEALVDEAETRAQLQVEKQQLANQLHQAQKMEAVGQLAGGVAHDFNNVLTAIRGNLELASRGIEPSSRAAGRIAASLQGVDRAAELASRLLAFSRRKVMPLEPTSVNACIRSLEPMLRQLIGEEVLLQVSLEASADTIMGDGNQLELALLNLALNARDAMPQGGHLTLRSSNIGPREEGGHPELVIQVSDTGQGMDQQTCTRIFEPFYTTKGMGQGTGLGLTMVFAIVQQHHGSVQVRSALGHGTTFTLTLPTCETRPTPAAGPALPRSTPGGHERILLVEDDDMVLETTQAMLDELGYRVEVAADPQSAIAIVAGSVEPPDLLLTDVVLPGMNGRELAERLLGINPGMKVVFTSGYTEDDVLRRGVASEKVHFLAKPFSPSALARKLRQVLSAGPEDPPEVTEELPRRS